MIHNKNSIKVEADDWKQVNILKHGESVHVRFWNGSHPYFGGQSEKWGLSSFHSLFRKACEERTNQRCRLLFFCPPVSSREKVRPVSSWRRLESKDIRARRFRSTKESKEVARFRHQVEERTKSFALEFAWTFPRGEPRRRKDGRCQAKRNRKKQRSGSGVCGVWCVFCAKLVPTLSGRCSSSLLRPTSISVSTGGTLPSRCSVRGQRFLGRNASVRPM